MKVFKFNGDWETELHLDHLTLLQNDRFFSGINSKKIKEKLLQGLVDIRIFDGFDNSPDPTNEQLSTINFIQENGKLLLDTIFERVKTVVYPFMKSLIDEDELAFPIIDSTHDLEKVLGLISIDIFKESKEGLSYFSINFYASWDDEHGFHILFHKNKILDTGEGQEFDYKKICDDCGVDYEKQVHEFNHWDDEIFDFIKPNPKYGKLKPGEVDSNDRLPFRLISRGKSKLLIDYIDQGKIDINYGYSEGSSFLVSAMYNRNEELIGYLTKNGIKNFLNALEILKKIDNPKISDMVTNYYEKNKEKLWLK